VRANKLHTCKTTKTAKDVTTWLKTGTADHLIAQQFSLEQIAQALDLVESDRAVGKVVLTIV
jgi:NADPH:quinone reductase-like Zn-dependent oxidoreductase